MKKIIMIMLVVSSFSCSLYDSLADYTFKSKIVKNKIYCKEEFLTLTSPRKISVYLHNNVTPKEEQQDKWIHIEEMLKRGYGDCEDFSLAFINIYYVVFKQKCNLVLINYSRKIVEGGKVDHVVVQLPTGEIWDPIAGAYLNINTIGYIYPFDFIFTY